MAVQYRITVLSPLAHSDFEPRGTIISTASISKFGESLWPRRLVCASSSPVERVNLGKLTRSSGRPHNVVHPLPPTITLDAAHERAPTNLPPRSHRAVNRRGARARKRRRPHPAFLDAKFPFLLVLILWPSSPSVLGVPFLSRQWAAHAPPAPAPAPAAATLICVRKDLLLHLLVLPQLPIHESWQQTHALHLLAQRSAQRHDEPRSALGYLHPRPTPAAAGAIFICHPIPVLIPPRGVSPPPAPASTIRFPPFPSFANARRHFALHVPLPYPSTNAVRTAGDEAECFGLSSLEAA
ncbi:hypothetical protein K438DRAFT_1971107 [Mycena galopus ATCC 62051]|nr:hypothetical protein K438DRAFT_1971107 [Mycena galopus ATCC 62051]